MNQSSVLLDILNRRMLDSLQPVTIFIILELIIGFFGNCLIMCVYLKAYTQCNFRYFVLFLAVYDLTSCFTTLPGEVYAHFNWYNYKYDWLCKIKSFFNVFTAWGSAFTLFLLALDRCLKICRPLNRQIRPELAKKLCFLGLFLSALVSVPILFLWGLQSYTYESDGIAVNVSICEKSSSHASDNYPFIYISSVYSGPIGFMMMAICVCNVLLARTLMRRMLKHTEIKDDANKISLHPNGTNTRNVIGVSFRHNGIQKGSSFASLSVVTDNCVTESTGLDNVVRPTSFSIIHQSTSTEQCKGSLKGSQRPAVFSIEVNHDKENIPTSFQRNIANRVHSSNYGQARISGRKPGSVSKRRKTLIMLTLTSVYIVTMTTYICLVSLVAEKDGIFRRLSDSEKVVFFFFLRLYFVNTSINPILYGIMDPRFKNGLRQLLCKHVPG